MKIIAFSGKKQSGKSTAAEFIEKYCNQEGRLKVKTFSFADLLKEHVCIDILGLTRKQCYGTDEEKDSYTHLKWEDMPIPRSIFDAAGKWFESSEVEKATIDKTVMSFFSKTGYMTGREVMQFFGTEIFRGVYPKVWCQGTINKIKQDCDIDLALITDCRFPDEVEVTQEADGKVIRFTKNTYNDSHKSETALDDYNNFDATIDNTDMSVEHKNELVLLQLKVWLIC